MPTFGRKGLGLTGANTADGKDRQVKDSDGKCSRTEVLPHEDWGILANSLKDAKGHAMTGSTGSWIPPGKSIADARLVPLSVDVFGSLSHSWGMKETLLQSLQWRYATKSFDRDREIPVEIWAALEEALRLTPSSYGLQPWKFLVIRNQEIKDSLVSASYGQAQVSECSHLLVIAVKRGVGPADVDHWIEVMAETRGVPIDSLNFFRNMIICDVVTGGRSVDGLGWAKLQAYIALGNFMTSAALLGIDCCPMEGFVPERYDEILGLETRGLSAAVVCPAGYRADSDKHARLPKARSGREEVIETIW